MTLIMSCLVLSCPVLSPGGSINTSGFCLGCGFFFHSINIRRARSAGASSSSRQFVQTPLLAHLGNYVVHSNPAIDIATNPASSPPARLRTAITMMRERYRVAPKRQKPTLGTLCLISHSASCICARTGYVNGGLLFLCAMLGNIFHSVATFVAVLLHAFLFPAWLIVLGVGVHKAAGHGGDGGGDTARLSDQQELSDQQQLGLGPTAAAATRQGGAGAGRGGASAAAVGVIVAGSSNSRTTSTAP